METSKDFEEFFELLNRNSVRYLVVGGYAYAIHAEPRYTKDLDIFFERSRKNAEKICDTLKEFGMGSLGLSVDDLIKPGRMIQIGYEPLRIDLINEIDGVSFDEGWGNRLESAYGKQPIYVMGKADLIKNKRASGREQDILDARNLEKQ